MTGEAHYRRASARLLRAGLRGGERVRLSVAGDSMAPFLWPGDAIWAEFAEPATLRRGDVVVIWHPDGLVTHRLVVADAGGWYAKGDNRTNLDPLVSGNAVLGRVVAIERGGDAIELRGRRWAVANWLLGVISLCEARLFELGRRVLGRLFGKTRRRASFVARASGVPKRALKRLLRTTRCLVDKSVLRINASTEKRPRR